MSAAVVFTVVLGAFAAGHQDIKVLGIRYHDGGRTR